MRILDIINKNWRLKLISTPKRNNKIDHQMSFGVHFGFKIHDFANAYKLISILSIKFEKTVNSITKTNSIQICKNR